jgi:hypothetical protein
MAGLLFLVDIFAILLIAVWALAREREPTGGFVTLFDMTEPPKEGMERHAPPASAPLRKAAARGRPVPRWRRGG